MRRLLTTAVLFGAACWFLTVLSGCEPGDDATRLRGNIPEGGAPEQADRNEPEKLQQADDPETRYESGKPDDLEGMEQTAAPLRYVTTSVRMRGHAQDTLDAAQATRALNAFRAQEDRLPESMKELREWADDNGWPVPEPSGDGVYVYSKSKKKLIIVDPDTLE